MARILVVDDSPDVRLALATILEDAGHDVVEAEDGDQVFDLAVSESPNLVLLDVMMPNLDGIETCRRLKSNPETADIPVLMITSSDTPATVARAFEAGCDDFMTKPLNEKMLVAKINALVA